MTDNSGADHDHHDHHEPDADHDHHEPDADHDHHEPDADHHDHHHHDVDSVSVAVVTVSSTRSTDEDPSGDRIVETFEDAGHEVVVRELIRDEFDGVQGTVDRLARREDTDAVVTTGGTGVTPDDVTPEAIAGISGKELPGFGELFRRLSYEEVGTRTIGSRATAAIVRDTPVFCLPGSENAVQLGVEEVILPEVGHLAGLASRDEEESESE